jgi:hypothetical protein
MYNSRKRLEIKHVLIILQDYKVYVIVIKMFILEFLDNLPQPPRRESMGKRLNKWFH